MARMNGNQNLAVRWERTAKFGIELDRILEELAHIGLEGS